MTDAQRKNLRIALVLLLVAALGFALGWLSAPSPRGETSLDVETSARERVVYRDRVIVRYEGVKDTRRALRRETRETKHADGSSTKVTVEEEREHAHEEQRGEGSADRAVDAIANSTAKVSEKQAASPRSDWMVAALVGTNVARLELQPLAPYLKPVVLGVHVQRRILGPVHVGAYGLSDGSVGGSLGVAF